jgi:sugar O-acyltransferase (sialic acid O-acetyltransferase NeuD family)
LFKANLLLFSIYFLFLPVLKKPLKKAVIIGARADGHAKVVLEILLAEGKVEVAGFIDDDVSKKGQSIRGYQVLGTLADLPELKKKLHLQAGIIAIGDNARRRSLGSQLEAEGMELVNAIHPTVHLDSDVIIGKGNYLGQGVIVVTGTTIGNCVNIHTGATIDHDNRIEDGANLGPGVHTAGRVTIGRDAFLGTGTCVIPDGVVGEGAITGAGTVVISLVEPYTKVVGVPARLVEHIKQ